ncbi:MAG: ATP-binding cassette domain-containing protein [Roseomonas sp.]|nr:ATP-binding cassette domain-containing protein [Roseomonas sp.]MCA3291700.1 ATP-binding cassette domain-containing protein [Roseomonas sp.]MCA3294476.1 ATP-binding cassette domain-containing protein [Roseomonas sp.]
MRAPDSILPLSAEGLGFSAGGVEILRDVSLKITAGAPTLLIGANGAGKSVLLRLLHGLLKPSAGRVFWAMPTDHAARRQAMVFQRPVLLRRSVLANTLYPMALAGVAREDRDARAEAALALVGLADRAADPARKLSVGQQQRLALARAAALQPELLFLDEPSASLDPAATRAVEEIVLKLAQRRTKIVMTTHDLAQARRLAGDVVFLHRGSVLEQAPADAFFQQPASTTARAFLRGELVW